MKYLTFLKSNSTEAWSTILIPILMDIPYLINRSIIINGVGLFAHPNIVFFWLKNITMILIYAYRLRGLKHEYNEMIEKIEQKKDLTENRFARH